MNNTFIRTKNVKNFVSLMDSLQKLPPNIPKLALVYGEHGLGKTHAIMWWATRNDAIYVRANNEMTQNALLKAIVEELGERPFYMMQENYNLILKHLESINYKGNYYIQFYFKTKKTLGNVSNNPRYFDITKIINKKNINIQYRNIEANI